MWKITTEPDRPQMTVRRTRISCWIPKATNTLRICNTAFPLQQCLLERASMLRYVYIACLVLLLVPTRDDRPSLQNSSFRKLFPCWSKTINFVHHHSYEFFCGINETDIVRLWLTGCGVDLITLSVHYWQARTHSFSRGRGREVDP